NDRVCTGHFVLSWSTSFFLSASLRRSICTLFPYTTLFRSRIGCGLYFSHRSTIASVIFHLYQAGVFIVNAIDRSVFQNIESTIRDRKSTRLNSSHVKISYAVFCLKKKNLQPPQQLHDQLII